jgi:hypothetical protein
MTAVPVHPGSAAQGSGLGPAAAGIERRRHGRVRCEGVACSLGRVVDVSASGAKVEMRGRPAFAQGELFTMTIHAEVTGPFALQARIVWTRKVGLFKHHAGLCFENVTPEARQGLMAIAAAAASREIGWRAD